MLGWIIAAYFYSSFVAECFIALLMYRLRLNTEIVKEINEKDGPKQEKHRPNEERTSYKLRKDGFFLAEWQVIILGIVERVLYLTSLMVGKPEFIAVWLTLKTVYESWSKQGAVARRDYNNFLVGNGLSILYAFAGAGIIQWATGSILPSTTPTQILQRSISLAYYSAATPIILSIILIAFLYLMNRPLEDKYQRI